MNLGEQFTLQRRNDTLYGSHALRQLWLHPLVDQPGDLVSVRQIIHNDFLKQLPGIDTVAVPHYAGQFDIGPSIWSWFNSRLRSSIRLFRYWSSSRSSRCSCPEMKPALSKLCRSRSAIHFASYTSILLPGSAFMCDALTTMALNPSGQKMYISFQYTPVLSTAIISQSDSSNQFVMILISLVAVPNSRSSCLLTSFKQAMISFLCTSIL